MALLDQVGLGARLDRARRSLFRMETLPAYAVTSDGDDFHRWQAGEREPSMDRIQPWLDKLRAERDAGKVRSRVRLLSAELTPYEVYSIQWGYSLTSPAGEDIRVLRAGEHDLPINLVAQDFWVVEGLEVLVMRYDTGGGFLGAEPVTDIRAERKFRRAAAVAWDAAEPFDQWRARHPELHGAVTV